MQSAVVPCYCCGVEFQCFREHVSTVADPPQPLCPDCCPVTRVASVEELKTKAKEADAVPV